MALMCRVTGLVATRALLPRMGVRYIASIGAMPWRNFGDRSSLPAVQPAPLWSSVRAFSADKPYGGPGGLEAEFNRIGQPMLDVLAEEYKRCKISRGEYMDQAGVVDGFLSSVHFGIAIVSNVKRKFARILRDIQQFPDEAHVLLAQSAVRYADQLWTQIQDQENRFKLVMRMMHTYHLDQDCDVLRGVLLKNAILLLLELRAMRALLMAKEAFNTQKDACLFQAEVARLMIEFEQSLTTDVEHRFNFPEFHDLVTNVQGFVSSREGGTQLLFEILRRAERVERRYQGDSAPASDVA
eukprot:m.19527 g.19527  ORF g.19527 m.19527 type:complete len:297 (-) comp3447_c0_seq2:66-956(-)